MYRLVSLSLSTLAVIAAPVLGQAKPTSGANSASGVSSSAGAPAGAPAAGAKASEAKAQAKKTYQLGDVLSADTKLIDLDNKVLSLGSLRGKVVVLDFWSIQCPISVRYEKRLKELYTHYAGKDVVILAVNPNNREMDRNAEDPAHKIRAYVKKAKVPYRVLIDRDHRLADALQAATTPHAFVLDKELRLVYEGGIDSDRQWYATNRGKQPEPWLRQAVDATLAGRPIENKSTKEWGCGIKRIRKRRSGRKTRPAGAGGLPEKKKAGTGVDR